VELPSFFGFSVAIEADYFAVEVSPLLFCVFFFFLSSPNGFVFSLTSLRPHVSVTFFYEEILLQKL
jgi:hypothetical protein